MYGTKFTGISTASIGRYDELLTNHEKKYIQSWLRYIYKRYGWQLDGSMLASNALLRELIFSSDTKPYIKI